MTKIELIVHVTRTTSTAGDCYDVINTSTNLVPHCTSPKDGRNSTSICYLCSLLSVLSNSSIFNSIFWITFQKRTALWLFISEAWKYFFGERQQAVQRNCREAEQNRSCLSLWVSFFFQCCNRGFIEVHVVTFLCLYETRVSPISARSVLSYIFSRQNQHEEQRAPVATYSTKIHSENLRFSFLLVAVWQRSCYETSVTNWSGFMNCFLEMRCKDNFNMSKWLFLIYFVWASTFLMSILKRTIYQKPKRKQPEYVYQNA